MAEHHKHGQSCWDAKDFFQLEKNCSRGMNLLTLVSIKSLHLDYTKEEIPLFQDGVKEQNRRIANGQGINPEIILDYPYSSYYGHKFMVTREFYGVNRTNRLDPNQPTQLENVWMVCAWFLLELNEVCTKAVKLLSMTCLQMHPKH